MNIEIILRNRAELPLKICSYIQNAELNRPHTLAENFCQDMPYISDEYRNNIEKSIGIATKNL